MKKIILVLALISVLLLAGCTNGQPVTNQPGGDVIQPDGSILKADGTMVKPDGTMVKPDGTMIKPDGTMVKPDGTMILPDGTMVAPEQTQNNDSPSDSAADDGVMMKKSSYEPFTKEKFEAAKASGKKIFLNFYADWCPICGQQEPIVVQSFESEQVNNAELIGFRVNYRDNQTDSDEEALASQYGISYQHSHVLLSETGEVLYKRIGESYANAGEAAEKITQTGA